MLWVGRWMMWPTVLLQGGHCICESATVPPNSTSQTPVCSGSVFSGVLLFWLMDPSFQLSWQLTWISKLSEQPRTLSSGLNRLAHLFIHFSVYSLHSNSWWTCLKIPWPLCRIQEMKGINCQRSQISILMITGNVNLVKKPSMWNTARQAKSLSKPA